MRIPERTSLKELRAKASDEILAWAWENVSPEEYYGKYLMQDPDSKLERYLKLNSIKDLEPALTELLAAHRIRNDRESKFEPPLLDDDDVPDYINLIKQEIVHRIKAMPYQVFELGRLLCVVKKLLPHGKFDDWILNFLPISKSTATNYVRVYRNCLGHPEILDYFKQSVLYEICSPRFPPDFRGFIFENITGEFDIKNKELLEVAIKWKNKEVSPRSPEVRSLLKNHRLQSEAKNYINELENIEKFLKNRANKIKDLSKTHDPHPYLSEDDNMTDHRFNEIEKMILGFVGQIDSMKRKLESNQ